MLLSKLQRKLMKDDLFYNGESYRPEELHQLLKNKGQFKYMSTLPVHMQKERQNIPYPFLETERGLFAVVRDSVEDFDLRNIEAETESNTDYRRVLYTAKNLQLVIMCLKANEEIGAEEHNNDQFIRIEEGKGIVDIGGQQHTVKAGDSIVIKAGTRHNISNASPSFLKLYTLYSPPHHEDGLVQKDK